MVWAPLVGCALVAFCMPLMNVAGAPPPPSGPNPAYCIADYTSPNGEEPCFKLTATAVDGADAADECAKDSPESTMALVNDGNIETWIKNTILTGFVTPITPWLGSVYDCDAGKWIDYYGGDLTNGYMHTHYLNSLSPNAAAFRAVWNYDSNRYELMEEIGKPHRVLCEMAASLGLSKTTPQLTCPKTESVTYTYTPLAVGTCISTQYSTYTSVSTYSTTSTETEISTTTVFLTQSYAIAPSPVNSITYTTTATMYTTVPNTITEHVTVIDPSQSCGRVTPTEPVYTTYTTTETMYTTIEGVFTSVMNSFHTCYTATASTIATSTETVTLTNTLVSTYTTTDTSTHVSTETVFATKSYVLAPSTVDTTTHTTTETEYRTVSEVITEGTTVVETINTCSTVTDSSSSRGSDVFSINPTEVQKQSSTAATCHGISRNNESYTPEELTALLQKLKTELTVNKMYLSSKRRRKKSAWVNDPGSQVIGAAAIIAMCAPILVVILNDLPSLLRKIIGYS